MVISRNRRQARLGSDSGVHSYGDYGIVAIKLVNKIKLNVSNDMYRNYIDLPFEGDYNSGYSSEMLLIHYCTPFVTKV